MTRNARRATQTLAVAYFRKPSAPDTGADTDSLRQQRRAVRRYAKIHKLKIVKEFYDPTVSGADPIQDRSEFGDLLRYLTSNGAKVMLVENASRFACDPAVQITGHDLLKKMGVDLIPVDAPDYFMQETPTTVLVRQILGAASQFEKASRVQKLRKARERTKAETGRCEGRMPVPDKIVKEAKRLRRKNPRTGRRRSLRRVAAELAEMGYLAESGKPYGAESVKQMIAR